jgi:hypothetical protein
MIQQPDDNTRYPQRYLYPEAHPSVEREAEEVEIPVHPEMERSRRAFFAGEIS